MSTIPTPVPANLQLLGLVPSDPRWNTACYAVQLGDAIMPQIGSYIDIGVAKADRWAIGAYFWAPSVGTLRIVGRPNDQTLTVRNDGQIGNLAPGETILAGTVWVQTGPGGTGETTVSGSVRTGSTDAIYLTPDANDQYLGTILFAEPFLVGSTVNVLLSVEPVGAVPNMGDLVTVYARGVSPLGFQLYASNAFPAQKPVKIHYLATTSGVLPANLFQSGQVSVTMTADANDQDLGTVAFPSAFPAAPRVFLTVMTDNPTSGLASVYPCDVTAAGFKIKGSNDFASARNVAIAWVAI